MKAATGDFQPFAMGALISIHAAREGGDFGGYLRCLVVRGISIHAAREGGDCPRKVAVIDFGISIHAAREGGDERTGETLLRLWRFQSTPPVKAAT